MTEPRETVNVGYYHGDDAYGLERAAAALGARVAGTGGPSLRIVRVPGSVRRAADAAEHLATILEQVATASLFGDGALVIVSDVPALLRFAGATATLVDAVRLVAPGERGCSGLVFRAKTRRKSSPKRTRNASSSATPNSSCAFARNSGEAPHQRGTRSGCLCAKASSTRSREFMANPSRLLFWGCNFLCRVFANNRSAQKDRGVSIGKAVKTRVHISGGGFFSSMSDSPFVVSFRSRFGAGY